MAWLWLISVGVTDVQFPVWKKDQCGQWTGPWRFEIGRGGIHAVHEGLRMLLDQGQIVFPPEPLPKSLRREESQSLRLEFEQEDGVFIASLKTPEGQPSTYRISGQAGEIPNAGEPRLPLYCPKVSDLLDVARETFGQEPVTVVVLNTQRHKNFPDGADEPIASGPLVARFLAERLGLAYLDQRDRSGAVPSTLAQTTSTWVDILTGEEAAEDSEVQQRVVRRLAGLVRAWNPKAGDKIAITTAGGIPPLKPIIERVPATCVGQAAIRLLDSPEQRGPKKPAPRSQATVAALNYGDRVAERETLRFHCVEALRQGDYAGAYGLASRFPNRAWAEAVRNRIGPLLELPGGPLQINGCCLAPFALNAWQVETALCMGDVAGALKRLGLFMESSIWALIGSDARIRRFQLQVDREENCLVGDLPQDHFLFTEGLLRQGNKEKNRHVVLDLTWRWPLWLAEDQGMQTEKTAALERLLNSYNGEPRKFRNLFTHGSGTCIKLSEAESCLRTMGFIADINKPFGQNFLIARNVNDLLSVLGGPNLASAMGGQLKDLLNRVIEG